MFLSLNPDMDNFGVFGGDNKPQSFGRQNNNESQSRKAGDDCSEITLEVKQNKYVWPKANWFWEHNRVHNFE